MVTKNTGRIHHKKPIFVHSRVHLKTYLTHCLSSNKFFDFCHYVCYFFPHASDHVNFSMLLSLMRISISRIIVTKFAPVSTFKWPKSQVYIHSMFIQCIFINETLSTVLALMLFQFIYGMRSLNMIFKISDKYAAFWTWFLLFMSSQMMSKARF